MNLLRDGLFIVAGVGAGAISTSFGIGGGALSTPAIRALGTSALMSIGTTLPPVLPGVVTGLLQYRGKRLVRYDVAIAVGIPGIVSAVGGSLISHHLPGNGHVIMLITATVLLLNAVKLAKSPKSQSSQSISIQTAHHSSSRQVITGPNSPNPVISTTERADKPLLDNGIGQQKVASNFSVSATNGGAPSADESDRLSGKYFEIAERHTSQEIDGASVIKSESKSHRVGARSNLGRLTMVGILAGLISGGLGLGGGIILVPVFARQIGLSLRESTATSLACIGVLAVPSIITHSVIGDINWTTAALLTVGTIPGAHFGAKLAMRASDLILRRSAAGVLSLIAIVYATTEVISLVH